MFDLFEMKMLTSLHCNVYGQMDSSTLRFLGCPNEPLPPPTGEEDEPEHVPVTHVVMDYFPRKDTSYFFCFSVHGTTEPKIKMAVHEPLHVDTVSPACTALLPDGRAISGTVDGSLVVWDVPTLSLHGNLIDKVSTTLPSCDKMIGQHLSTRALYHRYQLELLEIRQTLSSISLHFLCRICAKP